MYVGGFDGRGFRGWGLLCSWLWVHLAPHWQWMALCVAVMDVVLCGGRWWGVGDPRGPCAVGVLGCGWIVGHVPRDQSSGPVWCFCGAMAVGVGHFFGWFGGTISMRAVGWESWALVQALAEML